MKMMNEKSKRIRKERMAGRSGGRISGWIRAAAALLTLALLLWLGWTLVNGVLGVLGGAQTQLSEPDPMFAEEAERITRPPELDAQEPQPQHKTLDDYVPDVESPVDMTVEELIREAQQASSD